MPYKEALVASWWIFSSVQGAKLISWNLLKVTQRITINGYNGDVSGDRGINDDGAGDGHDSAVAGNDGDASL